MKKCYYEILDVDKKATPAQIKTNYRKLALKYHPDKNSEDNAKERFVEINEAYNVLSDPNERTWYDNNREKMLFNKDEMSKQDIEQYSFGFNIWTYFTTACFKGYEDSEGGFYAVYRDVFEKIKAEEVKAFNSREDLQEDLKKYEGFGDSTTSQDRVLKFYEDWQNFTTYKTFIWIQEWDTRDANSRWVRREMEKENKKQRQGEKKTYIKTIKDLILYVRKRDPRFIEYLRILKEEEEKKEKERLQREKEKKKEKEEMKVVKQKLEEERFRQIEQYYKKQNQQNANQNKTQNKAQHFEQEPDISQFYCQICEKQFKSENQLRNHQKSKQHKQMVKDIEKQVLLKEDLLRAEEEAEVVKQEVKKEVKEEVKEDQAKKKKKKKKKNQDKKEESQPEEKVQVKVEEKKAPEPKKQVKKEQPKKEEVNKDNNSSSDDDDHFMNTLLNNRVKKNQTKNTVPQPPQPAKKKKQSKAVIESQEDSEQQTKEQKLNKAKLKKQKKAQQEKTKVNDLKCNVCNQVYPSKTKLFEHINKSGHASTK